MAVPRTLSAGSILRGRVRVGGRGEDLRALDHQTGSLRAAREVPRALTDWNGQALPIGVEILPLQDHADARGALVEVFRASWQPHLQPVQWNLLRSRPGTLRGVHAHWKHEDYLVPIEGPFWLVLKDIRPDSPTHGNVCELDLHADQYVAVKVPTGVAHGFYFASDALLLYAVSTYWDTADELACAWNDPELGFRWDPMTNSTPNLSPRDAEAGTLADMTDEWLRLRRSYTAHG